MKTQNLKFKIVLIALLALSMNAFAQMDVVWKSNFNGSGYINSECCSVTAVSDGVVAVGHTGGVMTVSATMIKYNNNGTVAWDRHFSFSGYYSVTAVSDGIIAAGFIEEGGALIAKHNNDGTEAWRHGFGKGSCYHSVTAVSDGIIAVGYSPNSSFDEGDWSGVTGKGEYDAIIVKYNNNGTVAWKRNFGGSDDDYYRSVTAVSDGIIAVGNSYSDSFGNGDWLGVTGEGSKKDAIIVKYGNISTTNVTGVTFTKSTFNIKVNEQVNLSNYVSVAPSNATNKNVSYGIVSGGSYITLNTTTGIVTGTGEGQAIVKVTTADGGFTAQATINITATDDCTTIQYDPKALGWTASSATTHASGSADVTNPVGGYSYLDPNNVFDYTNQYGSPSKWTDLDRLLANTPGNYFMVNMKQKLPISKIVMDYTAGGDPNDYVRTYAVDISNDNISWTNNIKTGSFGDEGDNKVLREIVLPKGTMAQYFRIRPIAKGEGYWGITNMYVYKEECPCAFMSLTATISAGAEQGATATVTLASSLTGVVYMLYLNDVLVPGSAQAGNEGNLVWTVDEAGKYTIKAVSDGEIYCSNTVNFIVTITGNCMSIQYDPKTLGWLASVASTHPSGPHVEPDGGFGYLDPNNVFDYTGQYGDPIGSTSKWTDDGRLLANTPGNYFMVNMKQKLSISKIVMDYTAGIDVSDYARSYAVDISNDNINWTNNIKTGSFGDEGNNKVLREIVLPEGTVAQYFRIRPIAKGAGYWGITNMYVYKEECSCTRVPTAATITAAESTISQGATTTITLASSLSGATYTLYLDNVLVSSSAKAGNESSLVWTVGEDGRYTIKAIGDGATYCNTEVELDDDAIVSPVVGTFDITGEKTVVGIFDTLGRELNNEPLSGVYIVKYSDGTTKKFVK